MNIRNLRFFMSVFGVGLALPMGAGATTIDFSSIPPLVPNVLGGDLGQSLYTDMGTGLTVQAYFFNDGQEKWETDNDALSLYVRNQANDHGLGVCSPLDRGENGAPSGDCPGPNGGGDWNELDNEDARELIRLGLPDGYEWVSVQLSSLDNNSNSESEFGTLYSSLDDDPGSPDAILWNFMGTASSGPTVEPIFFIPASAKSKPFLFFEPIDWGNPVTNIDNNDFLVYQVTIDRRQVIEPGTLGILGMGLLALGRIRRKR